MKQLIPFLFLLCSYYVSFAQTDGVAGQYMRIPNSTDGTKLKWTLTLNTDGTFLYNFYRDVVGEQNPEENFYGKGTWKTEKNLIFLYTDKETDLDEKHTMDFTNSKARYIAKSSRDTSNKVIKPSLRFYQSDIFHIKGLELFKD